MRGDPSRSFADARVILPSKKRQSPSIDFIPRKI
jgi:hypothetical protein